MFDATLVYWLRSCRPLASLVQDRVFPLMVPQGETRPCVVWQLITGERVRVSTGPEGTGEPHYQIKCWADTLEDANAIATAIIGTVSEPQLDGFTGLMGPAGSQLWVHNAEVHSISHSYEAPQGGEKKGSVAVMFDVHIWYTE